GSRNGTSGDSSGICALAPESSTFCVVEISTTAGDSFSTRLATEGSCSRPWAFAFTAVVALAKPRISATVTAAAAKLRVNRPFNRISVSIGRAEYDNKQTPPPFHVSSQITISRAAKQAPGNPYNDDPYRQSCNPA